ncbi:MAG: sigma-70 family RNA polymerase sigma factor [Solirubrobacteraceae bacterium]
MVESASTAIPTDLEHRFELHRRELTGYCYRMLGSPFEAEDAVQETMLRAWRAYERFEGRSALRSWLYRIATNVCFDMTAGRARRARPMDLGSAQTPEAANLNTPAEVTWIEPIPTTLLATQDDPEQSAIERDTVRLAFVAALQRLAPRQRAALLLCEVMHWQAKEVAELLDTSVAAVNSALQRARATLQAGDTESEQASSEGMDAAQEALLARYVEAFEAYDLDSLTTLIREDARQSMPPYDMWLSGREDILSWWFGPGIECEGSKLVPTITACGSPAFGQYKPAPDGSGYEPWALQVIEPTKDGIGELTFFLSTERLFPLFGLPPRLAGEQAGEPRQGDQIQ